MPPIATPITQPASTSQAPATHILITGATGNVGSALVAAFPQRAALRIGVRNPTRAATTLGDDLHYAAFDFTQPETYADALTGVKRVFLVRPPKLANVQRDFAPFVAAMQAAEVQQVVFLSLQGVENNRLVPHHTIEALLRESGIGWTFLRAGFFAQNLSTTHREDICQHNEIFIPAGRAKISFIDVRDIADVAVAALTEPDHAGKAYTLTGPVALDYHEIAHIMTEELGRPIRYSQPSALRFAWRFWRRGHKPLQILIMILLYLNTRRGMAAQVSPAYEQIMGKAPRTMRQFVRDHRDCW